MTVSCAATQRVNTIIVQKLFTGQEPLSAVPSAAVADSPNILPYRGMHIVITENGDKASRIVNGQDPIILSSRGNTLVIQLPRQPTCLCLPSYTNIGLRGSFSHLQEVRPVHSSTHGCCATAACPYLNQM